MQRLVLRMPALLQQSLGRLFGQPDLHQCPVVGLLVLAEVSAQTALSIVNLQHGWLLSSNMAGSSRQCP
jgi:hypothetical protein